MAVADTNSNGRSYLDYLATTPVDPRVLDSMLPFFTTHFGNSSSRTHQYGWNSESALNKARSQIASLIRATPSELIFTSGATESNNLALIGLARMHEKPHFITLQTEHKAVLDPLRLLEAAGHCEVTYLPVEKNGQLDTSLIKQHIRPNTICISVMGINNEIGVIQNLKEVGRIANENDLVFHCDAAQAVGKIDLDVNEMNIGLLSISGHKMYGPKGIGALFIRKRPRVRIQSITNGGGQERGLRSGTVPVALAVGLGKAAEIAQEEMDRDFKKVKSMSNYLKDRFQTEIGDVVFNGHDITKPILDDVNYKSSGNVPDHSKWYPGCLNVSFAYVEGEGLLMALKDIALSSGSACTSASLEPSYVLRALKTDEDLAHSSIRFGIGRFTTWKEIKHVADKLVNVVKKLRDMSPLWEMVKEGVDLKNIKWSEG